MLIGEVVPETYRYLTMNPAAAGEFAIVTMFGGLWGEPGLKPRDSFGLVSFSPGAAYRAGPVSVDPP